MSRTRDANVFARAPLPSIRSGPNLAPCCRLPSLATSNDPWRTGNATCGSTHAGVEGIIVVNWEGVPIRTTLDPESTVQVRPTKASDFAASRAPSSRCALPCVLPCVKAGLELTHYSLFFVQYSALVTRFTDKCKSTLEKLNPEVRTAAPSNAHRTRTHSIALLRLRRDETPLPSPPSPTSQD